MTSTPAAVDIVAAFPEARPVLVEDVQPGVHEVFDTFGGTHPVHKVVVRRYGVEIFRVDHVRSWHPRRTEIAVTGGDE